MEGNSYTKTSDYLKKVLKRHHSRSPEERFECASKAWKTNSVMRERRDNKSIERSIESVESSIKTIEASKSLKVKDHLPELYSKLKQLKQQLKDSEN